MTITVHEAAIHTATVEVRTLTIDGKQVTLAVFRQLQAEPIEDDQGQLRGTPWGTVNYHSSKTCDDRRGHIHLVWQLGDELRQDHIEAPVSPGAHGDRQRSWIRHAHGTGPLLTAMLIAGWRPEERNWEHAGRIVLTIDDELLAVPLHPAHREFLRAADDLEACQGRLDLYPPDAQGRDLMETQVAKTRRRCDRARSALPAIAITSDGEGEKPRAYTIGEAAEQVKAELARQNDTYAQRWTNWERFGELPQLFIAV